MGNESAIVFSGIAPHPPIMVPEVGGEAIVEVRGSIDAMAEFTRRIIENGAESVVLISPHAPLDAQAFVVYHSPKLYGDFASFRAPATKVEFPLDDELLELIRKEATEQRFKVLPLEGYALDHGCAVPLYFLDRNGWKGRVVALGYSFLSNDDHVRFGSCIMRAVNAAGRPVALVASGDLSHRLKPDAPAGYYPDARKFDEQVVETLKQHAPRGIIDIDQDLRRLAGECGYRSMLVALGATQSLPEACEVLHYEAPFGVGYLVAQLTNHKAKGNGESASAKAERDLSEAGDESLPGLARMAVENFVLTGNPVPPPQGASGILAERAACFVSIKTKSGDLRGCIGTIEPAKPTLAEELIMNAVNAATRDPRFMPVSPDELTNLAYSVDILATPEPAVFEDLDPARYGVIVEDESALFRGLLLPDIEGVVTAEQQVEIAKRKAGIAAGAPLKLWRFRVDRYREK
ncbi:MAG TPA: AmmeMemoRadiSam system protein A [Pyrinomonadaceae bacterium]|nr:AmmeMemoRadiSam system protein A [Pyrinomonadaceae bacterium]